MARAESNGQHVLLLGRDGPAVAAARTSADRFGLALQLADDPFTALEAIRNDAALEAVLVDFESFQPRTAALARAIRSTRNTLPIYLLAPMHLEPEARAATDGLAHSDYLVAPLDERDWRNVTHGRSQTPPPDGGVAPPPARATDSLAGTAELISALSHPLDEFLPKAARWAADTLGADFVRVRWSGETASWPIDAEDPADTAVLPMVHGELAVAPAEKDLGPVAALLDAMLGERQRLAAFRQMAFTDYLSGAFNRRYLSLEADRLIRRARGEGRQLTLLMFDIDDFKRYNDEFGHAVGDAIIMDVVRLMRECTRTHDVVARIGGDEFAVLFWDDGPPRREGSRHPAEAQAVIDRFRRTLASHRFTYLGREDKGTLTISGGLATFPRDGDNAETLLTRAMSGLNAAKAAGKNRIHLVGPDSAAEAAS